MFDNMDEEQKKKHLISQTMANIRDLKHD